MLYTGNYLMFIRSEEMLAKLEKRVESQVTLYSVDYGKKIVKNYSFIITQNPFLLKLPHQNPKLPVWTTTWWPSSTRPFCCD